MNSNTVVKRLKNPIVLIILAGILARLLYVIFMPVVNFAQYDIGTVDPENNIFTGHLGYAFWLVKNKAIPNFDPRQVYQFNHPPVHHILCAIWISIVGLFTDNTQTLMEAAQYVTLIYSVVTLLAFDKILAETRAGEKGRAIALLIFAFQPTLIMTAGSLNNDGAGLMFQMLAVWLALRWHRTKSYKDIIGVALTIGIGMLSKLSAGLIAVPIGILFIYDFINEWIKNKKFPGKRFVQYMIFGMICVPIGLSWVIRCYVKFGMPPTYIAFLPDTSPQYVGMYSAAQRLLLPNPIELVKNLSHGSVGMGWNIWVQLFRTSALGECDLASFSMIGKVSCLMMMALNLVVAVWAFVAFIRVYVISKIINRRKEAELTRESDPAIRILWVLSWLVMMYSYFSFANTYPHECSMNFRYVQFAMIPPLVALALGEKERTWTLGMIKNSILCGYIVLSVVTVINWCMVA